MRKLTILVMMVLFGISTSLAHDFTVNGIYYKKLYSGSTSVKVTYRGSTYSEYSNEYSGSITIPSTVTYSGTTYNVTSIDERAFYECSGVTSVTLPTSITSIGQYAFFLCSGLTKVNITDLAKWYNITFGDYYSNPLNAA